MKKIFANSSLVCIFVFKKNKCLIKINNKMKKVTILNTSILTSFGSFRYEQINVIEAKKMIENGFESAVGHQSTCDVLTSLLGISVPMNRIQYSQNTGDIALVFKLKGRAEEGKILTAEEIEKIGYEFGKLEKL